VLPDIVTTAKPLAAGLPLGAILTTEAVASAFHAGMHGTTFGGGPLACAVAKKFLSELESANLLAHVSQLGDYFVTQLSKLAADIPEILSVRGKGLMVAVELSSAELAKKTVAAMLERRIIINRTHEIILRFLPPYIIERQHVDALVNELRSALNSLRTVEDTVQLGKGAI